MMKKMYYVYVRDALSQTFWTVHVAMSFDNSIKDALEWAAAKTFGGDAFGIKEFGVTIPSEFNHGNVEPGLKGI